VIDDRMKLVGLQEFHDSVHRCSLSRTGYEYARATERENSCAMRGLVQFIAKQWSAGNLTLQAT
jgi:hypothetical protein